MNSKHFSLTFHYETTSKSGNTSTRSRKACDPQVFPNSTVINRFLGF